jgi:CheY-like chemotaxis protein
MDDAERILLVEDEPIIALACSRRIESWGYRVETAGTGEDALLKATGTSR